MFKTYILISQANGRYYFHHTSDINKRLANHNQGKVRSTKAYRPWQVLYSESFPTKSEAYKRELFFKSFEGRKWLIQQKIIKPKNWILPTGSVHPMGPKGKPLCREVPGVPRRVQWRIPPPLLSKSQVVTWFFLFEASGLPYRLALH